MRESRRQEEEQAESIPIHDLGTTIYAFCCLLSAVCCLLFAVCCLLFAVRCPLFAVCCPLSAVRCPLSAVRCLLFAVCCRLFAVLICTDPKNNSRGPQKCFVESLLLHLYG